MIAFYDLARDAGMTARRNRERPREPRRSGIGSQPWFGAIVAGCLLLAVQDGRAADRPVVEGLASVQGDGSLRVDGQTVRLHGAWFPDVHPSCRPVLTLSQRCSALSLQVLRGMLTGSVRCEIVRGGNVLHGICTVQDDDLFGPRVDLAAWLIEAGWALPAPGAPERYYAFEALARSQGAGLWAYRSFRRQYGW
jgi:endonuclease YncB( thermonuclease family)